MKYFSLSLLLCLILFPVYGAELFGVDLKNATRDKLRKAVNSSGLKLVQKAGSDAFYDIYKGASVLHKANYFFLGFTKKNNQFAFAEYEFNGLRHPLMLQKLINKYGAAQISKGKFITDQKYSWFSEGTTISFYQDWPAYKTRLVYYNPELLTQLRTENNQYVNAFKVNTAVYLEQAY